MKWFTSLTANLSIPSSPPADKRLAASHERNNDLAGFQDSVSHDIDLTAYRLPPDRIINMLTAAGLAGQSQLVNADGRRIRPDQAGLLNVGHAGTFAGHAPAERIRPKLAER